MPIDLKYKVLPSFIVDGVNYGACGDIRKPLPFTGPTGLAETAKYQMISPFVEARFYKVRAFNNAQLKQVRDTQQIVFYVSTGNFLGSSEYKNAFIQSFSLSIEAAYGATMEIVDTSGNDFVGFYNSIFSNKCENIDLPAGAGKNVINFADTYVVAVNVGYVFVNSEGQKAVYQPYVNSPSKKLPGKPIGPYINFLLANAEVTVEQNIWKYRLSLKAPDLKYANNTVNKRVGAPDQKIPFLKAAELMLDGDCPPKQANNKEDARVVLVRPPQGVNGEWSYVSEKGANLAENETKKGAYAGYNLPSLDAIRKNMDTFVTANSKGVFMCFPSGANDDALYLVEAESSFCVQKRGSISQCGFGNFLGTYVVNGGDLSPVIKFTPKINLAGIPNKALGGQAAGGTTSKSVEVRDLCSPFEQNDRQEAVDAKQKPGQAVAVAGAIANEAWNKEAPKNLPNLQAQAGVAAMSASNYSKPLLAGALTAEMEIQGDPRLVWSLNVIGSFVKIIFINPFAPIQQITPRLANPIETDWLAKPEINSMISEGAYQVTGCDHEIRDGSWVTKLKLVQIPSANVQVRG